MTTRDIIEHARLEPDPSSPYHGRYRVRADQVFPRYRPAYDVYLRVKPGAEAEVHGLYDLVDHPARGLLQLLAPADIRNPINSIEIPFGDDVTLLVFGMVADVIYIAEENIYAAIELFAPYVEDGRFFVYSTGDGDHRWIHEYTIRDGILQFARHLATCEIYTGIIEFYLTRADRTATWEEFVEQEVGAMAARVHGYVASRWWSMLSSDVRPRLRPAVDGDRARALELEWLARRSSPAAVAGASDGYLALSRDPWHAADTRWIDVEGEPVGWLRLEREADHHRIDRLVLAPAHQHEAIVMAVVRILQGEAIGNNCPLWLSLHREDPMRELYRRLEFREVEGDSHRVFMVHPAPTTMAPPRK